MIYIRRYFKYIIRFILLFFVVILCAILFIILTPYKADDIVKEIILENDNIIEDDEYYIIKGDKDSSTAMIFYPGALVEPDAYIPLMYQISKEISIDVIIVKMPLNLAVFNKDVADKIMMDFYEYDTWYLCGHSLGGAMISDYASNNVDKIAGLIVLGSPVYGDIPLDKTLTIYGSTEYNNKERINYNTNVIEIENGTHYQFGNYGIQSGYVEPIIETADQQSQTVEAMKNFIK